MTLTVNLDICSTFDWVSYEAALKSMQDRKIDSKIIKWYKQLLHSRTAYTECNGVTRMIQVKRGTPQGSILSPLIWSMVFESFLKMFERGAITAVGFADDCSLKITGIDPSTMVDKMNMALNKARNWGIKFGLKFVPQKTTAIFLISS